MPLFAAERSSGEQGADGAALLGQTLTSPLWSSVNSPRPALWCPRSASAGRRQCSRAAASARRINRRQGSPSLCGRLLGARTAVLPSSPSPCALAAHSSPVSNMQRRL